MNELSGVNILGVLGGLALLSWVAWDMPASIEGVGDKLTLRYNRWVRGYFLFAAFGIPLGLTVLAIVNRPKDDEEMWCLLFLYLLFAVLTLPCWWETMCFSLTISSAGLECGSPWRGRRFVPWNDVVRVSRNKIYKWYVVETRSGYCVRVPQQLIPGLGAFMWVMEQRLPGRCDWGVHDCPRLS